MNTNELENIVQYYKDGKIAHAYLIITNNIDKCYSVLLKALKNIFCVEYKDNCDKCNICKLIDSNSLPSLKVVEPDGNFIKKDQVEDLKKFCASKPIYTDYNVYVLKNAEKMNKESANRMLKFVEEPDSNVIGFFIVNNKSNMLPTIISRCQTINVNFELDINDIFQTDIEKYNELSNVAKDLKDKIDSKSRDLLMFNKNILSNYDKNDVIIILKILLSMYEKNLKNNDNYYKSKQIIKMLDYLNYNVNLELLLDRMLINIGSVKDESI